MDADLRLELQRLRDSAPRLRDFVNHDLLDRLHPVEQARLIVDRPVCLAEKLDTAGLHHVTLIRLSGHYAGRVYLDDHQQTEAFIVAAVGRLCRPGEDPNAMRDEFRTLVCEKLAKYEETADRVVIERLSHVMPAELEWLWPGYLAADKLAVLVGEPGVGKTLTALDIAARVTSGMPWPTDPPDTERREPASVILLSEMDDSADMLYPRLEAVGADLSRIHLVRTYVQARDSVTALPFSVAGSLDMLADCVERVRDCRLVIIDPLALYVEGSLNTRQITELLGNLVELAVDRNLAILVVSHFGRSNFHYASGLTAKFVAAARTVWRIVDDGLETGRRMLVPLKNNLGTDRRGLAFHIAEEVDGLIPAPKVVWESKPLEIGVQRSKFVPESPRLPNGYEIHRQEVKAWLRMQLMVGERIIQDILTAATLAGIGERTLRRARREMGVTTRKCPTGAWVWALPQISLDEADGIYGGDQKRASPLESCQKLIKVEQAG